LSYTPKGVYSIIFVTTPAPTVLPPSRIAKFNFSLIAIGVINLYNREKKDVYINQEDEIISKTLINKEL